MKTEIGITIGDGSLYQEHGPFEGRGYDEASCWSIGCDVTSVAWVEEEGWTKIRLDCIPAGDDAESDQPRVHLYLDDDEWEALKFMVDRELRRTTPTP